MTNQTSWNRSYSKPRSVPKTLTTDNRGTCARWRAPPRTVASVTDFGHSGRRRARARTRQGAGGQNAVLITQREDLGRGEAVIQTPSREIRRKLWQRCGLTASAYPTHERWHGGCLGVGVHFSKRVDPGTRSRGIFGGVAGDAITTSEAITILITCFSFSFSSNNGPTRGRASARLEASRQ
jgi:hypothetical protein